MSAPGVRLAAAPCPKEVCYLRPWSYTVTILSPKELLYVRPRCWSTSALSSNALLMSALEIRSCCSTS